MRLFGFLGALAAASIVAFPSSLTSGGDPYVPRFTTAPEHRGHGYSKRRRYQDRSRYMPHQGERECARRRRQLAKAEGRTDA